MLDPLTLPITHERRLFEQYGASVAYIVVENEHGDLSTGTGFHIGDGVFVTAAHVVKDKKITKIATTHAGVRSQAPGNYFATSLAKETTQFQGPYYHPDPDCDVAAIKLEGHWGPSIPLVPVIDDPFGNQLILRDVVIMGFPPIPGGQGVTGSAVLVSSKAEINAAVGSFLTHQRYYVASCLARGGYSGGPVLMHPHGCIGVVVESMVPKDVAGELGFMAVIPVQPILELLHDSALMNEWIRTNLWDPFITVKRSISPNYHPPSTHDGERR